MNNNYKEIKIKRHAKLISLLSGIYKKIGDFKLLRYEKLNNKNIIDLDLSDGSEINYVKGFRIVEDRFVESGIVISLKLSDDQGSSSLGGNFLSILEDYTICSCMIKIKKKYESQVNSLIKENIKYYFKTIKNIGIDTTEDLHQLGTLVYLEKGRLKEISTRIKAIHSGILENHSHEGGVIKDIKGMNLNLLLCAIIKYHIFRIIEKDEERIEYYSYVKEEIRNAMDWTCHADGSNCDLKEIQLQHNGYCKILFDGENYNYEKGKKVVVKHALKSAIATIISRNMSHIDGSHIEHGIRTKMNTFEKTIEGSTIYKSIKDKI